MLRQALLGLAVLLAGAAAPAHAQEVKLQLKFKEGETFWVEDVVTSKTNISLSGIPVDKTEQKITQVTSYTIKKVTAESVLMEMKIENVEAKSDGGLAGSVGSVMEKTKGITLTVTLTPEGKVKKLEGFEAVLKKLGDDPLVKDALNEEMFTKGIEQAFNFVPDKAVKKGDTWTRDNKYSLGPLGELASKNTFTYNGKGGAGEEIGVKYNMEYQVPKKAALGGLLKVIKGDLKGDNAKGDYVFDAAKGRLISSTSSLRIQGGLTVESSGMQLQMELMMEETSTSRVHDKNPVK